MKPKPILAALLLTLCFTGCRRGTVSVKPADAPLQNPEVPGTFPDMVLEEEKLPLFDENGTFRFSVVYPEGDGDAERCASLLCDAIHLKTKAKVTPIPDSAACEKDAPEILVGNTSRPESAEAAEHFAQMHAAYPGGSIPLSEYGGWRICPSPGTEKLTLVASDSTMLRKAAEAFAERWITKVELIINSAKEESGQRDPVRIEALSAQTRPALITPLHPTEDAVIADIVATDKSYGADPTGERDSTSALRKALLACANQGGGTVWLPQGQYRVTGTVEIPAFVTLRGEKPLDDIASVEDYGTVILAEPKSGEATADSLFVMRGSCGVVGLTVYYPGQSAESPVPYPYTFYVTGNGQGGYMLQTVRDVLVVNGWRGIGACVTEKNAHEQMTIENFRGTFLSHAAASYNEADVGTWKSISVSPRYWADSPFENAPDIETIRAYTREHAEGLVLGDLEWDHFADIEVEDLAAGIHTVKGTRVTFNGEMCDVTVRRCGDGLLVDDMDTRWGMNLARAVFEDCDRPITNNTRAFVKLTDVSWDRGEISGTVRRAEGDLSSLAFDYSRALPQVKRNAYSVMLTQGTFSDVSRQLQEALDYAGTAGGVLYVPAGIYRLDRPVTVPAGVELRGASSVATRDQSGWSKGTVFACYYGVGLSEEADALVTLSEGSGVNGLRFVYPTNGPFEAKTTACTVRGKGADVYCVNTEIMCAGSGIDFRACDGHYIKKVTACCYDRGIRAGGRGGYVEGCLQNGNVVTRNGFSFLENWIPEGELFAVLFPVLRSRSVFLTLEGAEGEQVLNYFAYGVKTVLEVRESRNVAVINLGGDNIGDKAPLMKAENSGLTVINAQRYNGRLYDADGESDFALYNPLSIGEKREPNIFGGEEHTFEGIGE